MKTSAEEYMNKLKEIQNSNISVRTVLPESEPRFIIDLDTRKITIPDEFTFLGVLNDTNAETIYFEMDRYFDDVDLSQFTIVVQFAMNGKSSSDGYLIEGISPITDIDTTTLEDKIIFGWQIKNDVTSRVGEILFAIRIYEIEKSSVDEEQDVFKYCLNTLTVSLPIEDTLNVGNKTDTVYPSYFDEWNRRMEELNKMATDSLSKANEVLDSSKEYTDRAELAAQNAENSLSKIDEAIDESITEELNKYVFGNGLILDSEKKTLSVDVTNIAEPDNNKPISSSGVYTIVGDIEKILSTI